MTADPVMDAVRAALEAVRSDIDPALLTPDVTLTELGCDSMDRAEIVTVSMVALDVTVPVDRFADVSDVRGLVGVLREYCS
ncbi:phosphopantetheine-binding protein [Glycomyces halotolerans]